MSNYPNKGATGRFGRVSSGRKPAFNNKPWGENRSSFDRPAMAHKTTCSSCGKMCEVPFIPNGKKPVYCKDCYSQNMGDMGGERAPRREFSAPSFARPQQERAPAVDTGVSRQLEALNAKLERLIQAVEALAHK